jgi:hypothetical protein
MDPKGSQCIQRNNTLEVKTPGRLKIEEDGYSSDFRGSQNYLKRRNNRTIIKEINAIIHEHNLSMIMWVEVCMIAVYVRNRSPHQI